VFVASYVLYCLLLMRSYWLWSLVISLWLLCYCWLL